MILLKTLSQDIDRAIDSAGGRVPSRVMVPPIVAKVLRIEINELRKILDQEPLSDTDSLYVRGIIVAPVLDKSLWEFGT